MVTRSDLDWWLALAPSLRWTFARTMADTPHSYVVRNRTLRDPDFTRAVKVIRTFGRPGKFYDRTLIYLIVDGTKWWTMGEPLEDCMIINTTDDLRPYGNAQAPDTASPIKTVYDELAPDYDHRYDRHACPECAWENRWVWELVVSNVDHPRPSVLDVGAGTGLTLDLRITDAEHYTGLDPSQAMLNELLRKHPDVTDLRPLRFEDALDPPQFGAGDFEVVLSLFGSPSYIHPEAFRALPALASQLCVLMHYELGYLPDYHTSRPEHLNSSRRAARGLLADHPGRRVQLGHFQVVVIAPMLGYNVRIPPLPAHTNHSPTAQVMRTETEERAS